MSVSVSPFLPGILSITHLKFLLTFFMYVQNPPFTKLNVVSLLALMDIDLNMVLSMQF